MEIIVALIAAGGAVAAAWTSARQNRKINETHKQVSQNSHKNDKPTVLDLIAELRDEQRATNARISQHIEWHLGRGKNE